MSESKTDTLRRLREQRVVKTASLGPTVITAADRLALKKVAESKPEPGKNKRGRKTAAPKPAKKKRGRKPGVKTKAKK